MTQDRLDQLDYYTLLGVEQDAELSEIRRAFKSFARRYHPDRFASAGDEKRERATAIYRRGSEAMQVLCDPPARKVYDHAICKGVLRLTADQRDRAGRPPRRPASEPLIQSPQARTCYEQAAKTAKAGDFKSAYLLLKQASEHEPDNALILSRMAKVADVLRRKRK